MLISVVMAVYNNARFLQNAVDSILKQSYSNLELIAVNDGSTDQTREILDQIRDPRVTVLHLEKNRGAPFALNTGIRLARGEWIAIHDADDISYRNRIAEQNKTLNEKPHLAAVGTYIRCIPDEKDPFSELALRSFEYHRNRIYSTEEIKSALYFGCPLTHGSMIYSKKAFLNAGRYDPNLKIAYDYDLFVRLIQVGPIENIPKKLYKYRRYKGSISSSNLILTNQELFYSCAKYIRNTCYQGWSKNPAVIVFGTERGVNSFIKQSEDNLDVIRTFHNCEKAPLPEIIGDFKQDRIDGAIILSNYKQKHVFRRLVRAGMKVNKNLFMHWSWL